MLIGQQHSSNCYSIIIALESKYCSGHGLSSQSDSPSPVRVGKSNILAMYNNSHGMGGALSIEHVAKSKVPLGEEHER